MTPAGTKLARGGTLLLDGGTGTELRRRGMALSGAAWSALASLTHYELLRTIHSDYIAAGADVITTNTFATTRFVLEAAGHRDEFALINARAVAAARDAREQERPRGRNRRFDLVPAAAIRRARVSRRAHRARRVPRARRNACRSGSRSADARNAAGDAARAARLRGRACRRAAGMARRQLSTRRRGGARRLRLPARAARGAASRRCCRSRRRPSTSCTARSPRSSLRCARFARGGRARSAPIPRSATVPRRRSTPSRRTSSHCRRRAGSQPARKSSAVAAARRRSTFALWRSCRASLGR